MRNTEIDQNKISSNPAYLSSIGESISDVIMQRRIATVLGVLASIVVAWCLRSNESLALSIFHLLTLLSFGYPHLIKVRVNFNLNQETSLEWEKFLDGLGALCTSKAVWIMGLQEYNKNPKYSAGAVHNISRSIATNVI